MITLNRSFNKVILNISLTKKFPLITINFFLLVFHLFGVEVFGLLLCPLWGGGGLDWGSKPHFVHKLILLKKKKKRAKEYLTEVTP